MIGIPEALGRLLAERGRLRFDEYVDWALYDAGHGFFATSGGAGRGGADFITSPEVGPLFAAVVARWLDGVWADLGRPDPFTVVEAAAGRGALAIGVRAARPTCAPALRWVLVERSAALRARQREHLPVDAGPGPAGGGPRFSSAADLPAGPVVGVVLANELLDNLPFRLFERSSTSWQEVWVTAGRDGLVEVLGDAPGAVAMELDRLAPDAVAGARVPRQEAAGEWVGRALSLVERGRVLVVDYADATASLAARPPEQWLRTYRSHDHGGSPLEGPGSQDITVEVALDQLPAVDRAAHSTQADWLRAQRIDDLVDAARAVWAQRAGIGDLAAVRARSTVSEADALTDPDGLGAFTVLEWPVP